MKVVSLNTKTIYEIHLPVNGENNIPCPECNNDRKKKNKKSLRFNSVTKVGFCHHCQTRFMENKPMREQKTYKVPEYKNITDLSDKAVKYFAGRGISQQTLKDLKVYSDRGTTGTEAICFPYFRSGKLVNIKWRFPEKKFMLEAGAELIFWNYDVIAENKSVVVVEGEIDLLSLYESGVKNVISVPNGAGSTDYIDECIELFDAVEKVILCTDNDIAGLRLKDDLIRRFGIEKCYTVNLLECKDANEFLIAHGGFELKEVILKAEPIPIEGVVNLDDIYSDTYKMYLEGMPPGVGINIQEFDSLVTWETKRVLVVTGIPSHGKSEFLDYLLVRLNMLHKWKVGYFSPENFPVQYHISKLICKISGKSFKPEYLSAEDFERCYEFVQNNYFFIYPKEGFNMENILSAAKQLIKKYGIRTFVIDPWNKVEHLREHHESETEYISRILDKLSIFAKVNDILVVVVAHPYKMKKEKDGTKFEVPNLYDISGSAHWYNKPDYGMIVYRDFETGHSRIIVQKVKFKHLGPGGECTLNYNNVNGRYESTYSSNHSYDNYLDVNPELVELPAIKPNDAFDGKQAASEPEDRIIEAMNNPVDQVPF